ncbi:hypothetical protein GOODEAATRI_025639, partial [Goodea atripinnis]
ELNDSLTEKTRHAVYGPQDEWIIGDLEALQDTLLHQCHTVEGAVDQVPGWPLLVLSCGALSLTHATPLVLHAVCMAHPGTCPVPVIPVLLVTIQSVLQHIFTSWESPCLSLGAILRRLM